MSTSVASVTKHFPSAENGFTTTTSGSVSSGATTVGLNSVAGYSNGEVAVFVIDPTDNDKKQTFTGTIDTSGVQVTGVVWTAGTNQSHALGATVVDYATATHISMVSKGLLVEHNQTGTHSNVTATSVTATTGTFTNLTVTGTAVTAGWSALGQTPNTVTYNGNRSYSLTFNSVDLTSTLSNGMRLQTTRTVSAPTQCTSLNGSSQYYNKTSPTGMTFTDDATAMAWVKLTSYGALSGVISRYNGTSGWYLGIETDGRVQLVGFNGSSANFRGGRSHQSIPLNRWVHIAATLDMSGQTHAIYIDGVSVLVENRTGGTNPTALIQAGDLNVGAINSINFFPGKIAQAAVFSSVLSAATIASYYSQGLIGTESTMVSGYSLNNSINDLNANANNLTANGSAVATNADSPFAQDDAGVPVGTTDCGVVQSCTFSTNSTVVIQVPEGCTIPTSGGVSTVLYSLQKAPFGFPTDSGRYRLTCLFKVGRTQSSPTQNTWYNMTTISGTSGGAYLTLTVAGWLASYFVNYSNIGTTNTVGQHTLSTGASTETDTDFTTREGAAGAGTYLGSTGRSKHINVTTQAPYYLNTRTDQTGMTSIGDNSNTLIYADLANL